MTTAEITQRFRLAELVNTRLSTFDGQAINGTAAPEDEDFTHLAVRIESSLWLALGTSLSVFPMEEATALQLKLQPAIERDYKGNEHNLAKVTSPAHMVTIDSLAQKTSWTPDMNPSGYLLHSYFDRALQLSTDIGGDPMLASLRNTAVFATEEEWLDLLDAPCSPNVVMLFFVQPHRADTSPCAETVIAGFFRSLRMMTLWKRFFDILISDESIPGSVRENFRSEVGRITGWTLYLENEQVRERFEQVQKASEDIIRALESGFAETLDIKMNSYQNEVDRLVTAWKKYNPKYLHYNASR